MKSLRGSMISDINITPLTDIFLVLLIVMMVVTPTVDYAGLNLAVMTVGSEPDTQEKPKAIMLDIGAKDDYSIDGLAIPQDSLVQVIKDRAPSNPDGIVIAINPECTHDAMTFALSAVNLAGITKINVAEHDENGAATDEKHKSKDLKGKRQKGK